MRAVGIDFGTTNSDRGGRATRRWRGPKRSPGRPRKGPTDRVPDRPRPSGARGGCRGRRHAARRGGPPGARTGVVGRPTGTTASSSRSRPMSADRLLHRDAALRPALLRSPPSSRSSSIISSRTARALLRCADPWRPGIVAGRPGRLCRRARTPTSRLAVARLGSKPTPMAGFGARHRPRLRAARRRLLVWPHPRPATRPCWSPISVAARATSR